MNESVEPKGSESVDELVEHVDDEGAVLAIVTRGRMRAERLMHRCTYSFVVRSSGRLVVHQRAPWKSIYPGFWDLAFGGVCGVGEPWRQAGGRELREEAGLAMDDEATVDLGLVRYHGDDGHVLGRVFVVASDEPVRCLDGEVVGVDEIALGSVDAWMQDRSVCLDTRSAAWPVARAHLMRS